MTPRDFVYWLQGFLELTGATSLTANQTKMVRQHLARVFRMEVGQPKLKALWESLFNNPKPKKSKKPKWAEPTYCANRPKC